MKKHDFSKEKAFSSSLVIFIDQRNRFSYFIRTALLILLLLSGTLLKAQQISLSLQKVPLSKAISELRKLTKYDFVYNDALLKRVGPVSIHVKNATLEEALREMFENKPISFQVSDGIIILKERKGSISQEVTPVKQSEPIKGTIFDESGKALSGATIQVKGTSVVTVSDHTGSFELPGEYKNSMLVISFLGYRQIEVEASNAKRIILTPSAHGIDEITLVASGYQSIPKERATGSFSKVDNATFNRQVSTDVISRLKGIAPSILFDERSGSPKLTIRGQATIFGNDQPLIVVDNFPYEGEINNINPNDIEEIDILKDAAATSIWGIRAGNGVIVIKTKKGRENQPMNVGFGSNITIGQKPDLYYIPKIATTDFIDIEKMLFEKGFYNTIINNTAANRPYSPVVSILNDLQNDLLSESEAIDQIDALRQYDLRDDLNKYLYQHIVKQQYGLNIKGGTKNYSYYFSAGFDSNRESEKGERFGRTTLNSNHVFRPIEKLELSAALSYNQNHQSTSNVATMLSNMGQEQMYPYARLVDDSGNPAVVIKDVSNVLKEKALSEGLLNWDFKPLEELKYQDNKTKQSEIRINTHLKYNFLPSISAEIRFQYENQVGNTRNYYDKDSYFMRNQINRFSKVENGSLTRNIPYGAMLDNTNETLKALNGRFQINYDQRWNRHQLNGIAGTEIREIKTNGISSRNYGFDPKIGTSIPVDYLTQYEQYGRGVSTGISPLNNYSETLDRMKSYYFNAAYNYDLKYVFSASARIDQSNLFGVQTNQKSVPLWSSGIKWNISKELFYNINWLPELSLRSTYGYSGNVDRKLTAYTTASVGLNYTNFLPAAYLLNPPNKNLRWEKNRMWNLGIDLTIRENRLKASVDYFTRKGTDLIGNGSIDPTTGFTSYRGNLANMEGKGVDIELYSKNISNKNFSWTTVANFSYARDKVTKYQRTIAISDFLNDNSLYRNPTSYTPVVGKSLFSLYSYPWAGLDPVTGQPRGYLDGVPSTEYSKIVAYLSADPANNLIFQGNALPPYFGAIRNSFNYKGFDISLNIAFRYGYNFRRSSILYNTLFSNYSLHGDYYRRWQTPGDELKTNVPSMIYPSSSIADQYYANSETLIEKGDHLRLQDIRLGYSFKGYILEKLKSKNLQVFGLVNNLGLVWKANKVEIDPDFPSSRPAKSIVFGFNFEF